jgi:Nucleotidyl transferase AbiEii toxin, Type IV TA system
MGASVRQGLQNYAKANSRSFEALQYYAIERFLYRLSVSTHAGKFLLKGALLLTAWRAPISRPTMDIDLLGKTSNEVDGVVNLLKDVARADVPDDGMTSAHASYMLWRD